MVCQICTSLKKREEHQHDQLIVIVIVVIGFSQSGARVIQNVLNKTPADWSQNQLLAFSDFATKRGGHLWLHSTFSGLTAHKTARKTCCFLLGPIRLPQVQLGFHVPRKKNRRKKQLEKKGGGFWFNYRSTLTCRDSWMGIRWHDMRSLEGWYFEVQGN